MTKKQILEQSDISALFKLSERDNSIDESEKLDVEPYSYWKSVFRLFFKRPTAIISIVLLTIMLLCAVFIPMFYPSYYSSSHIISSSELGSWKFMRPSSSHPFGCDALGRDLFVIMFKAVRVSFAIALVVSIINAVVGVIVGTIWGYFRQLDAIFIEVSNVINNIPGLLVYMLLAFILRTANVNEYFSLIFVMTITGWLGTARFIRNQILIINDREYNIASKTLGTNPFRIITHNLLPFILPVIVTNISLEIPSVIGTETVLSYFGVGLSNNAIAIGPIMTLGYKQWVDYPWTLAWPAIIMGIITISFYLLGQTLSDCLDPRTHR